MKPVSRGSKKTFPVAVQEVPAGREGNERSAGL